MEGEKISSFGARKKLKKKNRKFVSRIVAYLKSDEYLFAPLFSTSPPLAPEIETDDLSFAAGFDDALWVKKKGRMSEKVKEYLKSDCHMYGPMISPRSSLKGKLQITNLVTMEVSTSRRTVREDNNNYMNLRSEKTLHNARINSPKRPLVILEGRRNGVSRDRDLSPAFSSQSEEKIAKPDRRTVTIE